ncbi:MAG: Hsp20/alpha crystallin family protein [Nitrococcus mobilis]|nr:Hsp20/alpha crystallin family protein [Nitrococcus mobilis]
MNFDLSKWNPFRFLRKSPEEKRAGSSVPIVSRSRDPSLAQGFESTGSMPNLDVFRMMQELMREPLSGWGSFDRWFGDFSPSVFQPRVDVVDDGDALRITAELPGMERDDVEILAEDGYLWIRGEKKLESRSEEKGCYRVERAFGQFQRAIPLPEGADVEKARASFDKGLLTIRLPNPDKQESAARRIAIQ